MAEDQDMDTTPEKETLPVRPERRWGRTILRTFLLIVIPVAALVAGGYWYEATGRYITTENAYVKTNVIAVSADIEGRVTKVFVDENQRVAEGDLLFQMDPNSYNMAVRMAESQREAARQNISAMRAEYYQIVAEIEEKKRQLIIPYTLDNNDMRFATNQGFNSGDQFFTYLKDSFDALYNEGNHSPKMMSVGLHCRLTGRPGRIKALEDFIDYAQNHTDIWFCRRIDIAKHWINNFPPPQKTGGLLN